jgi:hypothetical protein
MLRSRQRGGHQAGLGADEELVSSSREAGGDVVDSGMEEERNMVGMEFNLVGADLIIVGEVDTIMDMDMDMDADVDEEMKSLMMRVREKMTSPLERKICFGSLFALSVVKRKFCSFIFAAHVSDDT